MRNSSYLMEKPLRNLLVMLILDIKVKFVEHTLSLAKRMSLRGVKRGSNLAIYPTKKVGDFFDRIRKCHRLD